MDVKVILIWVVIGIIVGWLVSIVVGGGGLICYLIIGFIGVFVGGFLFKLVGININLGNVYVNEIVVVVIGVVVVVLLVWLIVQII